MFCPSNPSNEVDDDGNPIVGGGGLSRRRRRDTTTKARRSSQLLENAAEEDNDDDYDRRRRSLLLLREDTTTMMSSSTSVGPGGKGERGASASSSSAAAVVVGRRGRGGTMATAMSTRGVSTSSSFTTTTTTGEEQAALNIDESKRAKRCKLSLKASKAKLIDSEAVAQALQASTLARQALERPRVGKQLLLSMALVRTNPRTPPSCYPAHGTILTDRFHWTAFPPLDVILRTNMRRYYELSTNKCQSKDQQEFNNVLVMNVKREAHKYGWEFDREAFDDKKIRDRIRQFYKVSDDKFLSPEMGNLSVWYFCISVFSAEHFVLYPVSASLCKKRRIFKLPKRG